MNLTKKTFHLTLKSVKIKKASFASQIASEFMTRNQQFKSRR